jgi:sulfate permease, SulP family
MPINFSPNIVGSLRDYNGAKFAKDVSAGVTVGIVALPLAIAFGIASGVKPEQGIVTAIVAGLIVAMLGGVRLQIAGPAGAFVGLLYSIVEKHGVSGLIISTMLAGVLMFLLGALRLGNSIRYVPLPVIIGFTNGIAVIIAFAQLRDLLGLTIAKMPSNFFSQIATLWQAIGTINRNVVVLSIISVAFLFAWQALSKRFWPVITKLPASLIVILFGALAVAFFDLQVQTIGTRFGGIPQSLPSPVLPSLSWASIQNLVGPILSIAFLGAVESLLCARVADKMSGDRHDPNQELMAQGIANVVTPLFGGFAATGTLARTVTNIKSGAQTPISSIVHSLTLLLLVLIFAPFAKHIPMASLAAVLFVVAFNMGDWSVFKTLRLHKQSYQLVLLASFLLTVGFDITVAVQIGLLLACFFFIHRMRGLSSVKQQVRTGDEIVNTAYQFKASGVLFFGSISLLDAMTHLAHQQPAPKVLVDLSDVQFIDVSFAEELRALSIDLKSNAGSLALTGGRLQAMALFERIQLQNDVQIN